MTRIRRRPLALLVATLVTATALAAGATLLLEGASGVPLAQTTDEADHVTLYQNGLAFVELERTFESDDGGEMLLTVPLPTSARLASLRVESENVTVREVRSSLASSAPLQPGERVVVHTSEGDAFEGTVVGFEQQTLVLSTQAGVTLVQLDDVAAIEVQGRQPEQQPPGTAEASILVEAPAGVHRVRVSYLAFGSGWTPSYALDVDTGELTFYATLTSLADWENVTLDLVSGAPHVVLHPPPVPPEPPTPYATEAPQMDASVRMESTKAAGAGDEFSGATPLGDLHRYRYDRPLSLARDETVRLAVEQGPLELLDQRYEVEASIGWGGEGTRHDVPVREVVELRNTLGEPLPPGVVDAYRDGVWVGQDRIESTPAGDTANLTLSSAQGVEAEVLLAALEREGPRDVHTYHAVVENHRDEPVDVRVELSFPHERANLVDTQPPADETTGASVAWNATLAAGERRVFELRYDVERPERIVEAGPRG